MIKFWPFALILTAIIFAWLHLSVMPTKVVATVQLIPIEARINGAVFGTVSSSKDGKHTTMLHHDSVSNWWWQITKFNRGWKALYSWWPFGIVLFASGIWGGFGLGVILADDKHGQDAAETLQQGKAAKLEGMQLIQQAYYTTKQAEDTKQEAQRSIRAAEHRAKIAEKQTEEYATKASEAERKLGNERIKHTKGLHKAGARITKLKKKSKTTSEESVD
jgi:hypothetical protein